MAGAPEVHSTRTVATVSPTSRNTRSVCSWVSARGSRPLRGAWASPACGPLPVTTVPTYSTTQPTTNTARVSHTTPAGHDRDRRAVALADPADQHDREADHRQRDQQVEGDDPRVEVGEHRDPADDRLGGDAERQQEGQPEDGRAAVAPGDHEGRDRHGGHHEGEHPVAELDRAVDAHGPVRHERLLGAPRPGRAAEPGAGQPDDPAGHDDQHVDDQRGHRGGAHPPLRPGAADVRGEGLLDAGHRQNGSRGRDEQNRPLRRW